MCPVVPVEYPAFRDEPCLSVVVEEEVVKRFGDFRSLETFADVLHEALGTHVNQVETVEVFGPQQAVASVVCRADVVHAQRNGVADVTVERFEPVAVVYVEHTFCVDQNLAVLHLCDKAHLVVEESVFRVKPAELLGGGKRASGECKQTEHRDDESYVFHSVVRLCCAKIAEKS